VECNVRVTTKELGVAAYHELLVERVPPTGSTYFLMLCRACRKERKASCLELAAKRKE